MLRSQSVLPRPRSFEVEKRVFLGVAAAVILSLLLPWRFGDEGPSYRVILVQDPPALEDAPLPDLPPSPPDPPPPAWLEPVEPPQPLPGALEVPAEAAPELAAEHFETTLSFEERVSRPRRPPAPREGSAVREGRAGLIKPRLLQAPPPEYPRACLATGRGGQVIVEALIDERGRVREVELLQGADCSALDRAALEAVRQRRYEAGRLEGRPVPVIAIIRVDFRLN